MSSNTISILIKARDLASKELVTVSKGLSTVGKEARSVSGVLFSLKTALAGAGMGLLAKDTLDTASSFEQLETKLDALTKGKGPETLEEINEWALEMPVNTQKAVDSFAMMQAMGLDPTIEKMETLVDAASIFGEDTMPRVARALGQMQTLGKLSAEELNQMAEAGSMHGNTSPKHLA